jgi:hypothetical protein
VIGTHVARRAQSLQAVVWSLLLGADSRGLYGETRCEGRDACFSGEECSHTSMDCCKRQKWGVLLNPYTYCISC